MAWAGDDRWYQTERAHCRPPLAERLHQLREEEDCRRWLGVFSPTFGLRSNHFGLQARDGAQLLLEMKYP